MSLRKSYSLLLIFFIIVLSSSLTCNEDGDNYWDNKYTFRVIAVKSGFSGYLFWDNYPTLDLPPETFSGGDIYRLDYLIDSKVSKTISIYAICENTAGLSLDIYLYYKGIEVAHAEGSKTYDNFYTATLDYEVVATEEEEETTE